MKLQKMTFSGYKSFDNKKQTVEFENITLLLGANGSGKSNVISFFKMMNFMTTYALQEYVGRSGGADSLLHFGAERTSRIRGALEFKTDTELSCGRKMFLGEILKMIRLYMIAEGKTEVNFAREVPAPYLYPQEIYLRARSVITRSDRNRVYKGGIGRNGGEKLKRI